MQLFKPTEKKPSLLKHDEVVTLFHELGHGIHDLVAKTIYSRFHGTNTRARLCRSTGRRNARKRCWTPSQLKDVEPTLLTLSEDYRKAWSESSATPDTPAPERIPDDVIDIPDSHQMHVNDALFNLRQLHFGIFDMTMHEPSSHEAIESLNPTITYNTLRKEISQIEAPKFLGRAMNGVTGKPLFGHLMGGFDFLVITGI